ncbi:Short/branched chain specific acyl-CoA dehydrogenase, mitochondrial [Neolecta irregularis DAH-3]|uniref:short-chain 2-methylacyl-CoA dehydrogenase n=1 Tax=Neolecta irregularis (strain DAH-3) TaxID=1198029 RepID=A0A1U7LVL9_NEOID|nr:Short/branched chain specific acyl-CoA dehydrogenase, mitochondrial [Neolecta irregularis DAH-3]|eukprot:OLL26561.1 Short/branched chain specific acyl-CoA dehydrogenase, mitochondrial [Neolecta irregularis DAH-3]
MLSRTRTAVARPAASAKRWFSVARRASTAVPILQFSDEETALQETVAQFAARVIQPRVQEMDENEAIDKEVIADLFRQGLMGIETPTALGGAGASFTSAIIAIEELARVDPSVSVMCDVHNTLVNTCFRSYASQALKEKYLPRLSTESIGSFCLSEPASGSDAFAMKARAEKTPDGYKLNGSKMWITNAADADIFLIFANLDPSQGYKGITCFVAEKDWGIKIAKKERKLGIRASSTCSIHFDDLHVPNENLLGKEGQGYKYAIELLNEGRIGIAAQMTGLALGAYEKAVSYCVNDRQQFGQSIGDFQGMQFQFAQAYTELEAARLLTYNAARLKENGLPFVIAAAQAKLYSSQVAQKVSGLSIEWMGGVGFTRETGVEKFWRSGLINTMQTNKTRDSKIGAIYEGTSNLQDVPC